MRILALDASLARCSVALVEDGVVLAGQEALSGRGQSALLAPMVASVLADRGFDAVAVTIGPGSFTGLRTAIALAHGLATSGARLIAVTVAEALAEQVGELDGRALWVAIDNRRGRVFLDRDGDLRAVELADLPAPAGRVAVAGDAAIIVCATLAARDADVRLTDARLPHARYVAIAAQRQLDSGVMLREAQPIYVDPPEAKLPAGGLRPAPSA